MKFEFVTTTKEFSFFRHGEPFIYPILNWAQPERAILGVTGVLVLTITVQMLLFWIYKLRTFIQRRLFPNDSQQSTTITIQTRERTQAMQLI